MLNRTEIHKLGKRIRESYGDGTGKVEVADLEMLQEYRITPPLDRAMTERRARDDRETKNAQNRIKYLHNSKKSSTFAADY